ESTAAGADGSPLHALLKSRASTELAASGNIEAALQLADDAIAVWRNQPSSRVLAELTATRERLAESRRDAPSPPPPQGGDGLPRATVENFTPGPTRLILDESLPPSASSSPGSDAAPTPGQTDRVREMRGLLQITVDPQTASNLEKSLDTLTSSSLTTRI